MLAWLVVGTVFRFTLLARGLLLLPNNGRLVAL